MSQGRLSGSLALALCAFACAHEPAKQDELKGTSWQLVEVQYMDGSVVRPDQPGKYTLAFQPDGKANARADCNRGSGAFYPGDSGQLTFGMFAVTRAMCPEDSLEPRFWRDLALVRSYLIRDGHLYLSLMADGGIYEFERLV